MKKILLVLVLFSTLMIGVARLTQFQVMEVSEPVLNLQEPRPGFFALIYYESQTKLAEPLTIAQVQKIAELEGVRSMGFPIFISELLEFHSSEDVGGYRDMFSMSNPNFFQEAGLISLIEGRAFVEEDLVDIDFEKIPTLIPSTVAEILGLNVGSVIPFTSDNLWDNYQFEVIGIFDFQETGLNHIINYLDYGYIVPEAFIEKLYRGIPRYDIQPDSAIFVLDDLIDLEVFTTLADDLLGPNYKIWTVPVAE